MDFKNVFDYVMPDLIEDYFKENEWKQKNNIDIKQYAEFIHNNAYKTEEREATGRMRYIDMTTAFFNNRYEKENVVKIDKDGDFGVNAAFETGLGVGLYRGDSTGKTKNGNKEHDFAHYVFPFVHAQVGGEATLAYNGNQYFQPEVGVRGKVVFQGRIYDEIDMIAKVSSQITDKDKFSAYITKSLHTGAYYPIEVAGMIKGYAPYGKGGEIGLGYERKLDNGDSFGIEAYYKKISDSVEYASTKETGEPENKTMGIRFSYNF